MSGFARPPRLASALLRLLLPSRHRAQLLGDLLEGYAARAQRSGRSRARRWYWRQLCSTDLLRLRREGKPIGPRRSPPTVSTSMSLDGLRSDLAYSLRSLRKTPLFTLTVVATLALGMGASTAMFTVVNDVLLRPLPFRDADRLVMVFRTVPRFGMERSVASYPDFLDWQARSETLDELAAYGYSELTWYGPERAEKWVGRRISRNLLPLLRVAPVLGRDFTAAEDERGGPGGIILSQGLWQTRFGADPELLGSTLRFDDEERTVVGIMPASFSFPGPATQFWIPLRGDATRMERDTNFLQLIGRLAAGSSVRDAQREIEALAAAIDAREPDANDGYGVFVESRHDFVVGDVRRALWVFTGAVTLLLVVACVNVANLLLVRNASRRGEMSLRLALGAGRGKLVRLRLIESAAIATVASGLGVSGAWFGLRAMLAIAGGQLPRSAEVQLDGSAFAFGTGLAAACALLFGTFPMATGSARSLAGAARSGATASSARGRRTVQRALVAVQVAVAAVILVSATLLVNSFARLTAVGLGFDAEGVVAGRVALPRRSMESMDSMSSTDMEATIGGHIERRDAFVGALGEAAAAAVRSDAIGFSYGLPLGQSSFSRTMIPAGGEAAEDDAPAIAGNIVAGDYFRAMQIDLIAGRSFEDRDRFEALPVMLVNESLAAAFWPGRDPIGQRVRIGGPDNPWTTVVGVVADVRSNSVAGDPEPRYYRPLSQVPWPDSLFVVVRTAAPLEETVSGLRRAVASIDAQLPLTDVTTAAELVAADLAAPRLRSAILSMFGILATLLAVVGASGMVGFVVADRRSELGVRLAVGARAVDVVRLVLAEELRPVVAGAGAGLVGGWFAARTIGGFLYEIGPFDPTTYAIVAALVVGGVGFACYLQARRAAAIAPDEVLRSH